MPMANALLAEIDQEAKTTQRVLARHLAALDRASTPRKKSTRS